MNGEIPLAAYAHALLRPSGHTISDDLKASTDGNRHADGLATAMVYDVLSLSDRRQHGIFFSGAAWAKTLVSQLDVDRWERFIDPSVGTGDLLIEICLQLPLEGSVSATLSAWSKRLAAIDLRESFLHIAWARIQSLAHTRHAELSGKSEAFAPFPLPASFRVGDALEMSLELQEGDCVIMNPPYQRVIAPDSSFVGAGKRSAAALHIEHVLNNAQMGVGIVALIPDVLRSGTSYRRFRAELSQRLEIIDFSPFGCFGSAADVDVAVLVGTTDPSPSQIDASINIDQTNVKLVGDRFSVKVGPVVPHRALKSGITYGYLTAKNAAAWEEISQPCQFENFQARLETGPFIIVRRTSSPSDKKRARASLVTYKRELLVENHLLILKPHSGTIKECRALMRLLKDSRTDQWLNDHIRCRHLTVSALSKLPWWD